MLIRIDHDEFNELKEKFNGDYAADGYVHAESVKSGEVIGLPIQAAEVAEAEKLVEHIKSIGEIDPWHGPRDPYIVVSYGSGDTELEATRCETLADAVCYMVDTVKGGGCAYAELCVDNGTGEAIYDVMRWGN